MLAAGATPAGAQIYTRMNSNGVVEATNVPDAPGFRLTYPGKGTLIHSRGFFPRAYSGEFDHHIEAAASVYGVSPDLVKAVIAVESEFDQLAVSSKGAQGLMQLMPFTARRFGVTDSFDAAPEHLRRARSTCASCSTTFQGDVALALAGYNAGENAVAALRRHPALSRRPATTSRRSRPCSAAASRAVAREPRPATRAAFYTPSDTLAPAASRRRATPAPKRARGHAGAPAGLLPLERRARRHSTSPRRRPPRASSTR